MLPNLPECGFTLRYDFKECKLCLTRTIHVRVYLNVHGQLKPHLRSDAGFKYFFCK